MVSYFSVAGAKAAKKVLILIVMDNGLLRLHN